MGGEQVDPGEGLGASQGQLEWAINAYTLVFAGLLFTFGVLGDRWGRAKTMLVTILLYSLCTGLSSISRGFADFALYRDHNQVFETIAAEQYWQVAAKWCSGSCCAAPHFSHFTSSGLKSSSPFESACR